MLPPKSYLRPTNYIRINTGEMVWWPFGSKEKKQDAKKQQIDPELQKYSSEVVKSAEEQQQPKQGVSSAAQFSQGFTRADTLSGAAKHNCAEYATAYSKCISYGSFLNRSSGCNTQISMLEKCQSMQEFVLEALNYDKAVTNAERLKIKAKADDLMIEAAPSLIITPEQEKKFHDLVTSLSK